MRFNKKIKVKGLLELTNIKFLINDVHNLALLNEIPFFG